MYAENIIEEPVKPSFSWGLHKALYFLGTVVENHAVVCRHPGIRPLVSGEMNASNHIGYYCPSPGEIARHGGYWLVLGSLEGFLALGSDDA